MNRLRSRKFWVAISTPAILIITKALGLDLDDNVILSISGVVSAYLLGQSYVDARK